MELIGSIWNTIIGAPGTVISVVGFVSIAGAVWILVKKAVKESVQAYEKVRWFMKKYKALFISGQGNADYLMMVKEIDEALESYAKVLDKLKLKKFAQRLRDLIKL